MKFKLRKIKAINQTVDMPFDRGVSRSYTKGKRPVLLNLRNKIVGFLVEETLLWNYIRGLNVSSSIQSILSYEYSCCIAV